MEIFFSASLTLFVGGFSFTTKERIFKIPLHTSPLCTPPQKIFKKCKARNLFSLCTLGVFFSISAKEFFLTTKT